VNTIKTLALATALLFGIVAFMPSTPAFAQSPGEQMQGGLNDIGAGSARSFDSTVEIAINTFLFIIGAVSVIMIIYGGFKYVTSAGESSAVASAKNTIMYAVIGLVVAMLAWFIASYVVGVFSGNSASDAGRGAAGAGSNAVNNASNNSTNPPVNTTNDNPR